MAARHSGHGAHGVLLEDPLRGACHCTQRAWFLTHTTGYMGGHVSSMPCMRAEEVPAECAPSSPPDQLDSYLLLLLGMEHTFWTDRKQAAKVQNIIARKKLVTMQERLEELREERVAQDAKNTALLAGAKQLYGMLTHNEVTRNTRIEEEEGDEEDLPREVTVADLYPPEGIAVSEVPLKYFKSEFAGSVLLPYTIPSAAPFLVTLPGDIGERYPATPCLGLTEGDIQMELACDSFSATSVVGVKAVEDFARDASKRFAQSACCGVTPELLTKWVLARLGAPTHLDIPEVILTSFAQLAMLHTDFPITSNMADTWLECILDAMHSTLPASKGCPYISSNNRAMQQLFHMISRSLVNDFK
eukprot:TRINITY_DN34192_c0_g1_i1.p1 TRINITY_DN34192_c0_g1~~TRINITY_DN34192_c0_g1_i1.p1  ORF type:complete len:359 (+),score=97.41 TRINITY_DN34192_c0_g1_i1:377-1453(+)